MWSNEIRKRKVTKKTGYNIVALERKTKAYGKDLKLIMGNPCHLDNGK
jgi:hypothetical protein